MKTITRLGGTCQAVLKIDPQTGQLHSRQATMEFSGEALMTGNPQNGSNQPQKVSITRTAKVSVELVDTVARLPVLWPPPQWSIAC